MNIRPNKVLSEIAGFVLLLCLLYFFYQEVGKDWTIAVIGFLAFCFWVGLAPVKNPYHYGDEDGDT